MCYQIMDKLEDVNGLIVDYVNPDHVSYVS